MTGCVSFFAATLTPYASASAFAFSRSFSNELLCLLSGMILLIPYEGDVGIFGFFSSVFRFL